MKFSKKDVAFWIFCISAIAGGILAVYLVLLSQGEASSEFCSISDSFDCSAVAQSKYSKLLGLPVALYGLGAYVLMLVGMAYHKLKQSEVVLGLVGTLTLIALGFSLYLTFVEAFILNTWCLLCVGSQIAVLLMTASYFYYRRPEQQK